MGLTLVIANQTGTTMSDDIVTRLRNKFQGQIQICSEAADEIERLRRSIRVLQYELEAKEEAENES